jgi:hypothetical protein
VVIQYGATERRLAAKRGAARHFSRFETLVGYRKKMGIAKFQVDATQYDPASTKNAQVREDVAERIRHAHEAAAHDKWFRQQVRQAIEEADDPDTVWVPHATVKDDMARQRAALQARIKNAS